MALELPVSVGYRNSTGSQWNSISESVNNVFQFQLQHQRLVGHEYSQPLRLRVHTPALPDQPADHHPTHHHPVVQLWQPELLLLPPLLAAGAAQLREFPPGLRRRRGQATAAKAEVQSQALHSPSGTRARRRAGYSGSTAQGRDPPVGCIHLNVPAPVI